MLKKFLNKIPAHFQLLIKLYGFNLLLFFIIRCVFYFNNKSSDLGEVPFFEKFMAFRMGLEFDSAVLSWIMTAPVLIWSIASFFRDEKLRLYNFGFYLFMILLLIYYLVMAADIPYFQQFGNHLNRNALLWNDDPGFIIGMIFGSFSYWGYLILFFLLSFVLFKISKRFFKTFKLKLQEKPGPGFIFNLLFFVFLSSLLTLGIRGRASDRSGIHEGLSIVSQNAFINQVAINANFTFWKTLLYDENSDIYKTPEDINDRIAYARNYLGIKTPFENNISREIKDTLKQKYNFVIVIMESMSVYKMGYYGGKNLTPHFNDLIKESVFFNNFFSSGIHTFNGLFSTTSGYPSILAEKCMQQYIKKPFHGLGPLLKEQGYDTYFYTTHDPHFDNMQGFYTINKFDHIVSGYDFNFNQAESSLGVPDHLLFDKMIEINNNRKTDKPFVSVLMTASDHGPWRIPDDIPFKPNGADEKENCTLYADWAIGRLMEQVKKLPWYKNTVFMFLGDHGLAMGHTYEMPISYNHVPFVIHQPAVFKADTISYPAYQPDVPATVMGIIGSNYTDKTFGVNILKYKHPFVVFSADDKIGCVDSSGYYFYKTLSNNQSFLRKYKNLDPENYCSKYKNKADSMHNGMMKIYDACNFFIKTGYSMNY